MYTVDELKAFEKEIADIYQTKVIRGPIHLRDGNEEHLIRVFEKVEPEDYVFASWASHLECLLKGVPPEDVKKEIVAGKSITLSFPEHRVYSSAIVGGICPIAVGTAWALKKQNKSGKVWCFIGDMTAMTGIAYESMRYAKNFDLPIVWVVGDNGKSVGTPTKESWGEDCFACLVSIFKDIPCTTTIPQYYDGKNCIYYKYELTYPHSGTGVFLSF